MWFMRCHVVVHFNLLALSLLLRGLQSWRCQRTSKGKQTRELAPLSLFHWVLYAEPYKRPLPRFSWFGGAHGWGLSQQSPRRRKARPRGWGGVQQLPWATSHTRAGGSSLPQAMAAALWFSTRTLPGTQCYNSSCKFDYKHLIPI